jgi:hypothetical protein
MRAREQAGFQIGIQHEEVGTTGRMTLKPPPPPKRQLAAARALAGITQEELAELACLHVNSIRYMERQPRITMGHSLAL